MKISKNRTNIIAVGKMPRDNARWRQVSEGTRVTSQRKLAEGQEDYLRRLLEVRKLGKSNPQEQSNRII